jgi:hypothetical protein
MASQKEIDFHLMLRQIEKTLNEGDEEGTKFVDDIYDMMDLLNEGDDNDYYGTEGWKHRLGWE